MGTPIRGVQIGDARELEWDCWRGDDKRLEREYFLSRFGLRVGSDFLLGVVAMGTVVFFVPWRRSGIS